MDADLIPQIEGETISENLRVENVISVGRKQTQSLGEIGEDLRAIIISRSCDGLFL